MTESKKKQSKKVKKVEETKVELDDISPERKEQGERKRTSTVKKVLKRRKRHEHVPRWNIYPTVRLNEPEINAVKRFPTNKVTTTKYTFWNFLPKNIFEQFRRATNFYFLLIVILTLIPSLTPLTPVTSILPLVFVLVVSGAREAYEDINRFRADRKSNNRPYQVLRPDGSKVTVASKDLQVGDVLFLQRNETFPADVVVLSTALPEGVCYVETAQLDGESNLKMLKALKETAAINENEVHLFKASVDCEEPHNHLYTFNARLKIEDQVYSLDTKQLLLRGASLRNTPWVYGVIVYSGTDTKLALNQKSPPSKFSTVERRLNRMVLGIFSFKMTCVLLLGILGGIWQTQVGTDAWYLGKFSDDSGAKIGVFTFFSYFVLLSFLIPQSLMVTLEIVKVFQAKLMEWDEEMMLDKNDPESGMSAKTSNLNDELALVKYIFSDKTGTLTQNKMEFSQCSINGRVYSNPMSGQLEQILKDHHWSPSSPTSSSEKSKSKDNEIGGEVEGIVEFMRALAICHSVIADEDPKTGEIIYQAQSPDELALLNAAKGNGFEFKHTKTSGVTVSELGQERLYPVLTLLEFTSDRASSSIIVRTPEGQIILYSKGADSKMLKRINYNNPVNTTHKKVVLKHINNFSDMGLRTLIVARRILSENEFQEWHQKYHEANTSIKDRVTRVAQVCELIEKDLDIIGCTAIEDKLQDGVPDTIDYLLHAGIKVWIITGDKQQTAINIGYSTKLLQHEQPKVIINVDPDSETPSSECLEALKKGIEEHAHTGVPIGVIIDGFSLIYALKDHPHELIELTDMSSSVVCCRVTPLQKAQIVRIIKTEKKEICLSIGDGANDVSMIQEAHIGVGIFGKEGTQAARASDYAIQQFSHLRRLVTVHGRYSFIRNTGCIQTSLYKNMAFFFVQFWFSFFNGYSAQTLYDDWVITFYNIVLTSAPPFFLAIFEKDITEDVIRRYPAVYKTIQTGKCFTNKTVARWLAFAFYHSFIIFMFAWLEYRNDQVLPDGRSAGLSVMGFYASTIGILVVLTNIGLEINYWTAVNIAFHVLSFLAYCLLVIVVSIMLSIWPKAYWTFFLWISSPSFYFTLVCGYFMCIVPSISWKYIQRTYRPQSWQLLQDTLGLHELNKESDLPSLEANNVDKNVVVNESMSTPVNLRREESSSSSSSDSTATSSNSSTSDSDTVPPNVIHENSELKVKVNNESGTLTSSDRKSQKVPLISQESSEAVSSNAVTPSVSHNDVLENSSTQLVTPVVDANDSDSDDSSSSKSSVPSSSSSDSD